MRARHLHALFFSCAFVVPGLVALPSGGAPEDCDRLCRDRRSSASSSEADASIDAEVPAAPMCTELGKPHIGLGGEDLAANQDGPPHGDRARAKPYDALLTEYARVLGSDNRPSLIDEAGGTFGIAPERWFLEPLMSAVFVDTAFKVAFEGCLSVTSDARYSAPPAVGNATVQCTEWARRFWSREATADEIAACVDVALDTTPETYGRPNVDEATREVTPPRRWAYACASVLTSAGFLTY
jgi:hypothetical protein